MGTTEDTTASTRDVVDELLHRIGTGDPRVAELYSEDCDWKLSWPEAEHGRSTTPWIRHRSARADAAAHFAELAEHHVPDTSAPVEVERVLVDGDDTVVCGVIRRTARGTGRSYRARFALHLTVEEGLVTRFHLYEDSLSVARAFGGEPG